MVPAHKTMTEVKRKCLKKKAMNKIKEYML